MLQYVVLSDYSSQIEHLWLRGTANHVLSSTKLQATSLPVSPTARTLILTAAEGRMESENTATIIFIVAPLALLLL